MFNFSGLSPRHNGEDPDPADNVVQRTENANSFSDNGDKSAEPPSPPPQPSDPHSYEDTFRYNVVNDDTWKTENFISEMQSLFLLSGESFSQHQRMQSLPVLQLISSMQLLYESNDAEVVAKFCFQNFTKNEQLLQFLKKLQDPRNGNFTVIDFPETLICKTLERLLPSNISRNLSPIAVRTDNLNFYHSLSISLMKDPFLSNDLRYAGIHFILTRPEEFIEISRLMNESCNTTVSSFKVEGPPTNVGIQIMAEVLQRKINVYEFGSNNDLIDSKYYESTAKYQHEIYLGKYKDTYFPMVCKHKLSNPPSPAHDAFDTYYTGNRTSNQSFYPNDVKFENDTSSSGFRRLVGCEEENSNISRHMTSRETNNSSYDLQHSNRGNFDFHAEEKHSNTVMAGDKFLEQKSSSCSHQHGGHNHDEQKIPPSHYSSPLQPTVRSTQMQIEANERLSSAAAPFNFQTSDGLLNNLLSNYHTENDGRKIAVTKEYKTENPDDYSSFRELQDRLAYLPCKRNIAKEINYVWKEGDSLFKIVSEVYLGSRDSANSLRALALNEFMVNKQIYLKVLNESENTIFKGLICDNQETYSTLLIISRTLKKVFILVIDIAGDVSSSVAFGIMNNFKTDNILFLKIENDCIVATNPDKGLKLVDLTRRLISNNYRIPYSMAKRVQQIFNYEYIYYTNNNILKRHDVVDNVDLMQRRCDVCTRFGVNICAHRFVQNYENSLLFRRMLENPALGRCLLKDIKPSLCDFITAGKLPMALKNFFGIARVVGDGNCWYSACSVALVGDPILGKSLRRCVMLELLQNYENYQKVLLSFPIQTMKKFIIMDGAWAYPPLMYLTSKVISRRINVYERRGRNNLHAVFYDANNDSKLPIHIFLIDRHFSAMIPHTSCLVRPGLNVTYTLPEFRTKKLKKEELFNYITRKENNGSDESIIRKAPIVIDLTDSVQKQGVNQYTSVSRGEDKMPNLAKIHTTTLEEKTSITDITHNGSQMQECIFPFCNSIDSSVTNTETTSDNEIPAKYLKINKLSLESMEPLLEMECNRKIKKENIPSRSFDPDKTNEELKIKLPASQSKPIVHTSTTDKNNLENICSSKTNKIIACKRMLTVGSDQFKASSNLINLEKVLVYISKELPFISKTCYTEPDGEKQLKQYIESFLGKWRSNWERLVAEAIGRKHVTKHNWSKVCLNLKNLQKHAFVRETIRNILIKSNLPDGLVEYYIHESQKKFDTGKAATIINAGMKSLILEDVLKSDNVMHNISVETKNKNIPLSIDMPKESRRKSSCDEKYIKICTTPAVEHSVDTQIQSNDIEKEELKYPDVEILGVLGNSGGSILPEIILQDNNKKGKVNSHELTNESNTHQDIEVLNIEFDDDFNIDDVDWDYMEGLSSNSNNTVLSPALFIGNKDRIANKIQNESKLDKTHPPLEIQDLKIQDVSQYGKKCKLEVDSSLSKQKKFDCKENGQSSRLETVFTEKLLAQNVEVEPQMCNEKVSAALEVLGVTKEDLEYIPPNSAEIKVHANEFLSCYSYDTGRFKPKSWPIGISKIVKSVMKTCTFSSDSDPKYYRRTSLGYAKLMGHCGCGIRFEILVLKKPEEHQMIEMRIIRKGVYKIKQSNSTGRQLRGEEREKIAKELNGCSSRKLFLQNVEHLDSLSALHKNEIQRSKHVLQKIKSEQNSKLRKFQNPNDEICHLKSTFASAHHKNTVLPGYIQHLNTEEENLCIHLFDFGSLKFHTTIHKRDKVSIYIDATGGLYRKRSSLDPLLYAVMIKTNSGLIYPLCNLITEKGNAIEIGYFLRKVQQSILRINPTAPKVFSSIAICDGSAPLINALSEALNVEKLYDYILRSWNLLKFNIPWDENRIPIFLCTAHVIKSFQRGLSVSAPGPSNKKIRILAMYSFARLQECFELEEFCKVSKVIIQTFLAEEICPNILDCNVKFLRSMKENLIFVEDEEDINVDENEVMKEYIREAGETTIRRKSPFYQEFVKLRKIGIEKVGLEAINNPYFCPGVVTRLENDKIAYFPLWAAAVIRRTVFPDFLRDTSAAVESEFRTLKHSIHPINRQYYSDFVRTSFNYQVSRIKECALKICGRDELDKQEAVINEVIDFDVENPKQLENINAVILQDIKTVASKRRKKSQIGISNGTKKNDQINEKIIKTTPIKKIRKKPMELTPEVWKPRRKSRKSIHFSPTSVKQIASNMSDKLGSKIILGKRKLSSGETKNLKKRKLKEIEAAIAMIQLKNYEPSNNDSEIGEEFITTGVIDYTLDEKLAAVGNCELAEMSNSETSFLEIVNCRKFENGPELDFTETVRKENHSNIATDESRKEQGNEEFPRGTTLKNLDNNITSSLSVQIPFDLAAENRLINSMPIFVSPYGGGVTRRDVALLLSGDLWVEDQHINPYLEYLRDVCNSEVEVIPSHNIFWRDGRWAGPLVDDDVDLRPVILLADHYVIPVNWGSRQHWFLLHINCVTRTGIIYDSIFPDALTRETSIQNILFLIQTSILPQSFHDEIDDWTVQYCTSCPQQRDVHSCGIFTMAMAESVMNNPVNPVIRSICNAGELRHQVVVNMLRTTRLGREMLEISQQNFTLLRQLLTATDDDGSLPASK